MQEKIKQKIKHELQNLIINFLFLAMLFLAFAVYRKVLIKAPAPVYFYYAYALFEALILAKILTIGQSLNLGQHYRTSRLFVDILYKTFIFSLFILVFTSIEHFIEGLFHGEGVYGSLNKVIYSDWLIILARTVVMFFVFIPFFGLIEVTRILTGRDLYELFFKTNLDGKD